jgi:uncharacterized membrane protein YjjP (DUF1212 family)
LIVMRDAIPNIPFLDTEAIGEHDPRISFAITLARALHRYGTPAHRLEETMKMLLGRLGLEGAFFAMPTGIFASFGTPESHRTSLIRTDTGELSLEKLSLLDELADDVIKGEIGLSDGSRRVEAIVAAPPRYPTVLMVLSFALASGTAARFFGGGWREMLVAGAIGMVTGATALAVGPSESARRVFEIVAAVIASALATLAALAVAPFSIYVATLAGLIFLVPGLTLTTAMTEIATGNLVSGTARLTGAVLTFLELGFGVALGSQIARLLPQAPVPMPPAPLDAWTLWLALIITPFAFTVLLQARPRDAGWIMLACILGFGAARLGALLLGPELGALVGACGLGLGANLFARLQKRPAAVPLLPGLILLVPGSVGFGSLSKFIERDVMSGVEAAFSVLLVAVALVTGLLLANVIAPARRTL